MASFAFTLRCVFKLSGDVVNGACQDASTSDPQIKSGRVHKLTSGALIGDKVSWAYQSSFLLAHFDVAYSGTIDGDKISGVVKAAGREGTFTAERE